MKKFAIIITALAMLSSNTGHAQTSRSMGSAATSGTYDANTFAWGVGLAGLVVWGVVVGLTAGAASSNPTTFSH